jgi:hypothetical protein
VGSKRSTANHLIEKKNVLLNVLPLRIQVRLRLISLQCLPGSFAKIRCFSKSVVNELFKERQLIPSEGGDLVLEDDLLKRNIWQFRVWVFGEEVTVLVDGGRVSCTEVLPIVVTGGKG